MSKILLKVCFVPGYLLAFSYPSYSILLSRVWLTRAVVPQRISSRPSSLTTRVTTWPPETKAGEWCCSRGTRRYGLLFSHLAAGVDISDPSTEKDLRVQVPHRVSVARAGVRLPKITRDRREDQQDKMVQTTKRVSFPPVDERQDDKAMEGLR